MDKTAFHEKMDVPRLVFGKFLEARFHDLIKRAQKAGFEVDVLTENKVTFLTLKGDKVQVSAGEENYLFDKVVICTGHHWCNKEQEGKVDGYFDSPLSSSEISKEIQSSCWTSW